MQAWVTTLRNEPVGLAELNPLVWDQEMRKDIIHRCVHWHLAKIRQGTHKGKRRDAVRGGGKKPHPQKKTGRARAGSRRSPLWKGGGKAHPPVPRDYDYPLPYQVRQLGIKVALSAKFHEGNLHLIDKAEAESVRTAALREALDQWTLRTVLFVHASHETDPKLLLAGRAIDQIDMCSAKVVSVLDLVRKDDLIISLAALKELEERLLAARTPVKYAVQGLPALQLPGFDAEFLNKPQLQVTHSQPPAPRPKRRQPR